MRADFATDFDATFLRATRATFFAARFDAGLFLSRIASAGFAGEAVFGDRFDAFVTDTSGRWIPDRAATLHFETGWRREGKRWLCINARWSNDSR